MSAARCEHHPGAVRCQRRLAGWSDDLSGSRYRRILGWLPPIGWMALIFFLSSRTDFGALSRFSFAGSDKVAHAVIYGVLAVLVANAVAPARWASGFSWVVSVAYGVTDEYHQHFVPGRDVSAGDLLADALGAALVLTVCSVIRTHRLNARRRGRGAASLRSPRDSRSSVSSPIACATMPYLSIRPRAEGRATLSPAETTGSNDTGLAPPSATCLLSHRRSVR